MASTMAASGRSAAPPHHSRGMSDDTLSPRMVSMAENNVGSRPNTAHNQGDALGDIVSKTETGRTFTSNSYSPTTAGPALKHHFDSPQQHNSIPTSTTSSAPSRQQNSSGPKMSDSGSLRNHLTAALAEFVGTFMFLFFAFSGTQIANAVPPVVSEGVTSVPDVAGLLYISFAFGISLMVNVFAFYRISGGQFNPVVSMALWLVHAITWLRAVFCIIGQILGGIAAAAVASGIYPTPLTVETTLGAGTTAVQGVFIEMFLTAQLVLVILLLAVEKHRMTYMAPLGIGFALFVTQLSGVYFTGASLNPARSLGPAVVNGNFPTYHWIYWIGPILGSLLATGFYRLLNLCKWQGVNPGQDWDGLNTAEAQKQGVTEPLVRSSDHAV